MRSFRWVVLGMMAMVSWGACASEDGDSADGHTSWLGSCVRDDDCADPLVCDCGICTSICSQESECRAVSATSTCVRVARDGTGTCSGSAEATSGICVPRCDSNADCNEIAGTFVCTDGACTPGAGEDASFDGAGGQPSTGGTAGRGGVGASGGIDGGPTGGHGGSKEGGPDAPLTCVLDHGFDAVVIDHIGIEGIWESDTGEVHRIAADPGADARGSWDIQREFTDRYYILELGGDFVTAFNDAQNSVNPCEYSRIDYEYRVALNDGGLTTLDAGAPYEPVLFVCETTHSAASDWEAWQATRPDHDDLLLGCNGNEWSRLTRTQLPACVPHMSTPDLSSDDAASLCEYPGVSCTICPQGDAGTTFTVFFLPCSCDAP